MAFTLKIQSKGLFNKAKTIDFGALLRECKLQHGSYNDFYVMDMGKSNNGTAILYNPARIGRGIFFDARNVGKGEITVNYNIPTTAAEIKDFVNVVKEVERQFGKASFHCEEENKDYTTASLESAIPQMIEFSTQKLNEGCAKNDSMNYILTLAMFPWYVDATIHAMQNTDLYYAKPSLFKDKSNKILAFYTLTSNCESLFPANPRNFLNMNVQSIDKAFIRFFIFEEKKVVDGHYSYRQFIEFAKQKGATQFDAERLRVPEISKEDIMEFVNSVSQE